MFLLICRKKPLRILFKLVNQSSIFKKFLYVQHTLLRNGYLKKPKRIATHFTLAAKVDVSWR